MSILEQILSYFEDRNPMQYRFLLDSINQMDYASRNECERYLSIYCETLFSVNSSKYKSVYNIIESYENTIKMVMKEQLYFKRNFKYRNSSFEQVEASVYGNKEFMESYMVGLAMTQFLWPNHREIFVFFREKIAEVSGESYLEVGPGHGLFFLEALKSGKFEHYSGVDISPSSIMLTNEIIKRLAPNNTSYDLVLKDVFDFSTELQFDFISFGEVLEHLENPGAFLTKIRTLLKKGGKAYISTCANSPAIDHIYLYNNAGGIRKMLYECGFEILDELVISIDNVPEHEWNEKKANVSYAAIIG